MMDLESKHRSDSFDYPWQCYLKGRVLRCCVAGRGSVKGVSSLFRAPTGPVLTGGHAFETSAAVSVSEKQGCCAEEHGRCADKHGRCAAVQTSMGDVKQSLASQQLVPSYNCI